MNSNNQSISAFHTITKPIGPLCNLNCEYCFYLEKEHLYPNNHDFKMSPEVLEEYVRQYIETQNAPEIDFAWQGGEPTLMGLDFFRRVVDLQQKYANGKKIHNAFQTNGVKLDDEWCEFLSENHFLVGVSIDGPRKIHDSYRVFKSGKPSFDHVMAGIERLKKYQVEFNTLTCVHHNNADQGKIIYRFLKRIGSRYIQFIPIVERTANENEGLANPQTRKHSQVTEWSVESTKYGQFLIDVFDEWIKKDVGKIFVQMFDVALASWYGVSPGLCVYSETCGKALAMEHNGDIYSCDHYVYPEFKLGNIMSDSLGDMVNSPFQKKFGAQKKNGLPKYCQDCEYRFACNGGCPKHRFLQTPDGEKGWNYLCKGYKKYFKHIEPYMRFMVNELQHNRPPANVMKYRKNIG